MDTLQSALQGVAQAVQSARQDREVAEQQAATHRGHVAELQSLYEKERLLREEAQAEVGRLRLRLSALEASSRPAAVPPPAPPGPDTVARSPRSAPGVRRHTAPLGGSASAWASFLAPTVQARLSSTTQELTRLRDALRAAQQVGGARDDGSLKLLGANNGESNRKNGEPSKALLMHVIPPTQPAPPSPHAPPTPLSPTASGGLRPRPRPRQPSEAALEKRGSVLSLSELSHMLRRALELQADAVEACSESLAGIEGGAAPGEEGEGELSPADQAQTSRRARHSFVPGGSLERRIVVQNAGHTPPKSPAPGSSPSPSSPPSSPSSSAHSSEADAEISLADDGSAGVGATAAAAMSVALAQAWAGAGARGAGPTSARRRREDEGVEDGEASQAGQANAQCDVHGAPAATESSSHLQAHSSEDSVCRNPPPSASALARASSSRQGLAFAGAKAKFRLVAAVPRGSDRRARGSSPEGARWPARQLPHGSRPTPASSSAALQGLEGEAVPPLGEAELRWREGASQLKLQWLSEPRTALLVAKPVPQAQAHAAQAALCLARRGIVAVVEPGAHGPLLQRVFALAGDEDEGGRRGERGFLTSPSAPALLGVGEEEGGATKQGTTGAILNSAFQQAVRAASPPLTRERLARLIVSWAPAPDLPDEADAVGELLPQPIPPDVAHRIDVVYTLGGDGTLLWTCALFGRRAVPPVVPFALGSLGFLTPFPPASLEGVLRHTLSTSQAFPLMLRHRLHCRVLRREGGGKARRAEGDGLATRSGEGLGARPKEEARSGAPPSGARSSQGALHSGVSASSTEAGATHAGDKPQHAPSSPGGSEPPVRECRNAYEDDGECCGVVLNELVIDRGQATSLTCLEVYADRHFVTVIAGDGLIVATPTGSTAYNLAAGGSMIHPGVPAMLFTPICPHTLASRPLVFPDNVTLSIRVSLDSRAGAYCGFDGKNRMHLRPGDGLVIKLSQWPVPTVCNLDASHDWFLAARDGLNWNVRHAQDPLHSPPRLER